MSLAWADPNEQGGVDESEAAVTAAGALVEELTVESREEAIAPHPDLDYRMKG